MTTETARLFDHAVLGAAAWVDEVALELCSQDKHAAQRALRAVLHAIRDRLEPQEAAQLAAQMPALVRALFWEGWRPGRHSPRHAQAFLHAIGDEAQLHGTTEASFVLTSVMTVLRHHISPGEIEDVLTVMPAEVRALLSA